jgi:signal transduction histidine kinase
MNDEYISRWQLSATDLHARQAELVEMLEDITRLTSDWVWSLSRDLRISFISDRIFDSCGILADSVVGKKLTEIGTFKSPTGEAMIPELSKPFRDLSFEVRGADGAMRYLLFSGLPVFARDTGAFKGVRGIGRDVTERVVAEKSTNLLASAINELSEAFCLYGPDDEFILCNNRFREVNDAIGNAIGPGRKFSDFVHGMVEHGLVPEAAGREAEWIAERMRRHQNPGQPFEVTRQNGMCFLIHEERLADGSTATMTTDITHRKEMELALKDSLRRHQVFMADVAHQLRTPLAVLSANLDTLEDRAVAQSIQADVQSLSRMVEGLLAETKFDDLEIGTDDRADLTLIVRAVAADLAPEAIKRKRSLEVIAPDMPVAVWGRTQVLEQAVRLLVENAIQQTPEKTVVTIEVTADPAVLVEDHGDAIPDDARDRIFMLGLRADQRGDGQRQGLSAVRRIADAHGAECGVADVAERGNVFFLRFPS